MSFRIQVAEDFQKFCAYAKDSIFGGQPLPDAYVNSLYAHWRPAFNKAIELDAAADALDKSVRESRRWGVQLNEEWDVRLALERDGAAYFLIHETSCDMVEFTRVRSVSSMEGYYTFHEELAHGAEGPYSVERISREAFDNFTPHRRDRVMEAFENGRNGWMV